MGLEIGPVVLEVPSAPASLFIVRAAVGAIARKIGFEERETDRIVLGVDEACTNVIRYAYDGDRNQRIILTFFVNLDYLEIHIRDFGTAADPAAFKSRRLEDVRPGGLGIYFIKSAFDKLDFDVPPDGGTLLRLTKFRTKKENGST